jgi:integrase
MAPFVHVGIITASAIVTTIGDAKQFRTGLDLAAWLGLRGCDLVKLKVADVFAAGQVKERASIVQSKTQKPVRFEITEGTRKSLFRWMEEPLIIGSEFLWPGRFHERLHISTRQYARLVRDWVKSIGLEPSAYGSLG